jgi:hypothetical protein
MSLRLSSPSSSGGAGRRQQSLEGDQDVPALVRGASRPRSIPSRGSRPSAGRQRACERRPGRSKNRRAVRRYRRAVGSHGTATRRGRPSTVGRAGSRPTSLDASEITRQKCEGPRRTFVRAIDSCADACRPARAICLLTARNEAFPKIQSSKTPAGSALGSDGMAASRLASDLRLWNCSPWGCTECCRQNTQPPSRDDLGRCGGVPATRVPPGAKRSARTLGGSRGANRGQVIGQISRQDPKGCMTTTRPAVTFGTLSATEKSSSQASRPRGFLARIAVIVPRSTPDGARVK